NASVVLRDIASRTLFPLPYRTNAGGELLLSELPGQYGVTVSNDEFQTSAIMSVSNGNTTTLDVSVNKTIRATAFNELRTMGSAGFAPPWEDVVVAIPADTVLYHPGDTVFIQRFLSCVYVPNQNFTVVFPNQNSNVVVPNQNFTVVVFPVFPGGYASNCSAVLFPYGSIPNNPEIKASVVYSDLRVENQTSLLWLNLAIVKFLSLDLLPGLQLVTYSATTQVSTLAG
ncbi:MAG TPA: hypothetical protein VIW22_03625, partial [Nitrososphaerales archaeon]